MIEYGCRFRFDWADDDSLLAYKHCTYEQASEFARLQARRHDRQLVWYRVADDDVETQNAK